MKKLQQKIGVLAISIKEGWFYEKISSYKYLFKNLTLIRIKRNISLIRSE